MGTCLEKKKAPEAEEAQEDKPVNGGSVLEMDLDISKEFTPTNLGVRARQILSYLALPFPVAVALLVGGFLGSRLGLFRFFVLMILFFGIIPPIYGHIMVAIGQKLKEYIEQVDRDYIGVDIHIGEIEICLCYARFTMKEMVIDNPPGYNSDYLMKCRSLTVDLDLLELLMSKGKKIVVEEFTLDHIDVIVEYDSLVIGMGTSNVDWVKDFVSGGKKEGDEDAKKKEEEAKKKKESEQEEKKKQGEARTYVMQRVQIIDVGAFVRTKVGLGPRVAVADTRFKNFDDEHKHATAGDIIVILMKSMTKSCLATVSGMRGKILEKAKRPVRTLTGQRKPSD